ncbi:MAG: right-handed parallel beta-helix repeat-containing protein [Bacteroidales bacterium]|jgi:hypothetical protein|nr:right-handed parallel beta-helix repeat-containing protein [Bacteroidales bacterium]
MKKKWFLNRVAFMVMFFVIFFNSNSLSSVVFTKADSPYFITSDLVIDNQDTIIFEAGANLILSPGVNIITNGVIMMNGTASEPVTLLPEIAGVGWGKIKINAPGNTSFITHAHITDGIILSLSCHMTLDHVKFSNNQQLTWQDPIMFVKGASVNTKNSSIYGNNRGEGFLMQNSADVHISDCYFTKIPDAIELIGVNGGVIRKNRFENIPDDAIDLNNCDNTLIDSNIIINVADRGMELGAEHFGNSENILVVRNILIGCNEGIIFKENSSGQLINNTFYANNTGVSCIEDATTKKGSNASIHNCIFSGSVDRDIFHDANSGVVASFCLSDKAELLGESNLFDNPMFINANDNNFRLREGSPCIDAGNPDFPLDPDSTISDIGAFYYSMDTTGLFDLNDLFNQIDLYPNPFMGGFTISLPIEQTDEVSIELYSLQGQIIPSVVKKTFFPFIQTLNIQPTQGAFPDTNIVCKITIGNLSKSYVLLHSSLY